MWNKVALTTASNIVDLSFVGRGSIYIEGTFGAGTVEIKPKTDSGEVSASPLYEIDGTTVISADVPSGLYRLELAGSAGATIDVWYNTQVDLIRDS